MAELVDSPRSWPKPTNAWIAWVKRMTAFEGHMWHNLGIYHIIQLSTISFEVNPWLIGAAICFWSTSCNSLMLKSGMASPTILNIIHLTACLWQLWQIHSDHSKKTGIPLVALELLRNTSLLPS
ncbi:hypothetical protein CsSME_00019387 [Camellia sinensis var. sinensis]